MVIVLKEDNLTVTLTLEEYKEYKKFEIKAKINAYNEVKEKQKKSQINLRGTIEEEDIYASHMLSLSDYLLNMDVNNG